MTDSLGLLKSLPCPAGDACTAFQCLFKHEKDGARAADERSKRQKVASKPPLAENVPASARLQTSSGPQAASPENRQGSHELKGGGKGDAVPHHQMTLASLKRQVSPPPLKRKMPVNSPGGPQSPQTPPAKKLAASAPPFSPSSAGSSVTKATSTPQERKSPPKKTESLNPRHVKAAPAAHDVRFRLLKLLHDQLARLNSELKRDAKDDEMELVLSDQDLIQMALDEEERIATQQTPIYRNVISARVMSLKKTTVVQWKAERTKEVEKRRALAAPSSSDPSTPLPAQAVLGEPKVITTGLTPAQEVLFAASHLTTPIETLTSYGYVARPPTEAEVAAAREAEQESKGWEVCDRCRQRFQVFESRREDLGGRITSPGTCTYHPGKAYWPDRQPGDRTPAGVAGPLRRYRCCGEAVGDSAGCQKSDTHVFKTTDPKRLAALWNFVETPWPAEDKAGTVPHDRAVAFDCEMGYTAKGMELIRLTAVSWPQGEELLDVLVRPFGEVLDLNSRYSGVWPEDYAAAEPWVPPQTDRRAEEDDDRASSSSDSSGGGARLDMVDSDEEDEVVLKRRDVKKPVAPSTKAQETKQPQRKRLKVVPSPAVARDLLFSLLTPSTPLIGHGLENDLNATRIVHPVLIDTILLYPHRRGLPMRHGLRTLAAQHLGRAIQLETHEDGPFKGHDSAEDARAAGDLVRLRVMERWAAMQREGWTLQTRTLEGGRTVDEFVAPPGTAKWVYPAGPKPASRDNDKEAVTASTSQE